jgi:hypothetical protein
MQRLPRQILDICLLRAGPQDMPYSMPLTRLLVIALAAVELAYALILEIPDPLPRVGLSMVMLLAAPWVLLGLRARRERYLQTLAALAGAGLLFTLAFLPLALLAADVPEPVPEVAPQARYVLLGWLALLMIGWKLMINAHIYRHAMDWPRFPAMLLVVALFLIEFGLFNALFVTSASLEPAP